MFRFIGEKDDGIQRVEASSAALIALDRAIHMMNGRVYRMLCEDDSEKERETVRCLLSLKVPAVSIIKYKMDKRELNAIATWLYIMLTYGGNTAEKSDKTGLQVARVKEIEVDEYKDEGCRMVFGWDHLRALVKAGAKVCLSCTDEVNISPRLKKAEKKVLHIGRKEALAISREYIIDGRDADGDLFQAIVDTPVEVLKASAESETWSESLWSVLEKYADMYISFMNNEEVVEYAFWDYEYWYGDKRPDRTYECVLRIGDEYYTVKQVPGKDAGLVPARMVIDVDDIKGWPYNV